MPTSPVSANLVTSFYEALRKGQAVAINGQRGHKMLIEKLPPKRLDALPTFDFGHLNDPSHADVWPKSLYDDLWQEYAESNRLHLPFDRSIFIFHWQETDAAFATINYYVVEREGVGIRLTNYFRHPHETGLKAQLTRGAASIFVTDTMQYDFHASAGRFDEAARESAAEDLRAAFSAVVAAVGLINRRQIVREHVVEPTMAAVNEGRSKAKLSPLLPPVRVKLGDAVIRSTGSHTGDGSPRLPHNRRGHWRNLRSGKRVWVRDCAIHGGSDVGRNYVVKG